MVEKKPKNETQNLTITRIFYGMSRSFLSKTSRIKEVQLIDQFGNKRRGLNRHKSCSNTPKGQEREITVNFEPVFDKKRKFSQVTKNLYTKGIVKSFYNKQIKNYNNMTTTVAQAT